MMISSPAPVGASAAPAAAPIPPPAGTSAPPSTTPASRAPGSPPAGTTAPAPTPAPAPAPAPPTGQGGGAPADAAAATQAVIDRLMKTSASEAIEQVDARLAKVASITVGGATPEGTQGAKVASALLTDASMLLQHAHVKTMEQLRAIAGELHLKLMSSSSALAFLGGQVSVAGQSKEPVKLAEVAAGPIAQTKATIADVVAALAPPAAPKQTEPDAKPAPPDAG